LLESSLERNVFPALWLAWGAYWWAMSGRVKAAARTESIVSRLLHVVPLMVAALLLWLPRRGIPVLDARFLPAAAWLFWAGAALTLAGLSFTVWARVHLGRNWSGIVTVKEGHELITSGPYRIVRHPIYTGLLLAFVGSAVGLGEWRGVLAVALVLAALWRKLRVEEAWMREQFGAVYESYAQRVAALVPFLF
jgi:protein-S-isoprenylcysteine O-methyltransferase Ste14